MATLRGTPGVNMDSRCEDYNNDPTIVYHAHSLPRCTDHGVRWYAGRWLCGRHVAERAGERVTPIYLTDAELKCLAQICRDDEDARPSALHLRREVRGWIIEEAE